jgi:hypothetical protein
MSSARFVLLTVTAVALATPAWAQMPAINMAPQDKYMTSDEIEQQKEVDRKYKEAISKLPDQQRNNDPWGNVRAVDQSAPKAAAPKAAAKPASAKPASAKPASAKPARPKNAEAAPQVVR